MNQAAWMIAFIVFAHCLSVIPKEAKGAPTPYFGNPNGDESAEPGQKSDSENNLQVGGEWISGRDGTNLQRLLVLSWERDFVFDMPTRSFLNALVESDGGRLTLEFPRAMNSYVAFIAEYPFFYRPLDGTDELTITRFRGLGMGAGIMKRTDMTNLHFGAEWISGKLDGDVKDSGRKTIEFVQLERDRTRKAKLDEPAEGTRLFFSLSTNQFRGFASESEKTIMTFQTAQEWYHPLTETTTFGLIAREGADSRSRRFWTTTVGSFQEDDFNVSLPGYLYQQFSAKAFINGEAALRIWLTPDLLLHLGYYAAGGWSPHVYTSASAGITYLVFHKLPVILEGARGFPPSGAVELLAGTVFQW